MVLRVTNIETGLQQLERILPRIASFFQFLRDSEPVIQRRVNVMDEVTLLAFPVLSRG